MVTFSRVTTSRYLPEPRTCGDVARRKYRPGSSALPSAWVNGIVSRASSFRGASGRTVHSRTRALVPGWKYCQRCQPSLEVTPRNSSGATV